MVTLKILLPFWASELFLRNFAKVNEIVDNHYLRNLRKLRFVWLRQYRQ
jgi:hypothetical protein